MFGDQSSLPMIIVIRIIRVIYKSTHIELFMGFSKSNEIWYCSIENPCFEKMNSSIFEMRSFHHLIFKTFALKLKILPKMSAKLFESSSFLLYICWDGQISYLRIFCVFVFFVFVYLLVCKGTWWAVTGKTVASFSTCNWNIETVNGECDTIVIMVIMVNIIVIMVSVTQ